MEASKVKEKPQKEKASKAWRMEGQVKYVWVFAGKENTCIWSQDWDSPWVIYLLTTPSLTI